MTDPFTIIGTASALLSIIEVIGKTVSALHDLRERWKEAEFTFLNLIAQLTALKAALAKIKEWTESAGDELHHQLIMDLDVSTACCRMLIDKMDTEVSGLHLVTGSNMDRRSKRKLVTRKRDLEELQKMVERQTNALTLLLAACNCKTVSDQKALLEKTGSRKMIRAIREDTSSLYVNRDSTSLYSRCTDNLSKISATFQFDRDLFISKVYEKALRSSLKETLIRQGRIKSKTADDFEAFQQSQSINRMIREDAKSSYRESRVLLLGSQKSGKDNITDNLKLACGECTEEKLGGFRPQILAIILQIMLHLLSTGIEHLPELDIYGSNQEDMLRESLTAVTAAAVATGIPPKAVESVMILWTNLLFWDILAQKSPEFHHSQTTIFYAVQNLPRIASEGYQPTTADVKMLTAPNTLESRTVEHKLRLPSHPVLISDPGEPELSIQSARRLRYFEGVDALVFTIDLCFYDTESRIPQLKFFESVVNSSWFRSTSIMLLFTNINNFRGKLASSPLKNQFPDYAGGSDVAKAQNYILEMFENLTVCSSSRALGIRANWIESSDTSYPKDFSCYLNELFIVKPLHGLIL